MHLNKNWCRIIGVVGSTFFVTLPTFGAIEVGGSVGLLHDYTFGYSGVMRSEFEGFDVELTFNSGSDSELVNKQQLKDFSHSRISTQVDEDLNTIATRTRNMSLIEIQTNLVLLGVKYYIDPSKFLYLGIGTRRMKTKFQSILQTEEAFSPNAKFYEFDSYVRTAQIGFGNMIWQDEQFSFVVDWFKVLIPLEEPKVNSGTVADFYGKDLVQEKSYYLGKSLGFQTLSLSLTYRI